MLKENNVTQYDVAAALGLGVGRVKQMFAKQEFTVSRLALICDELLDIKLADLVEAADQRQHNVQRLSEQQEQLLISDARLLVVGVSVMNNWTAEEIVARYDLTLKECNDYLRKLEKLKLIKLGVNDRVSLQIDRNFHWIPDGPLEKFFRHKVQGDFLDAPFNASGEIRQFRTGMLSVSSVNELLRKIDKLVADFVELNRADIKTELQQRTGHSMVVAFRPWLMPAFSQLLSDSRDVTGSKKEH